MGHRPGYARDYYAANKDKLNARKRAWRKRNIERCRAVAAAWAAANPDKVRAARKRYRDAHRLELRVRDAASKRAKRAADPEKARELYRQYNQRRKARMAADPIFAAHWRAKHAARIKRYTEKMLRISARFYALFRLYRRKSHAKKAVLSGKAYRALYSRRIPDWCVKGGGIIDYRSQWLIENRSPAQRAYARELAMERMGLEVWR